MTLDSRFLQLEEHFDSGADISVRPLEEADVNDSYLRWFSDGGVTEFLDSRKITKSEAVGYIRHGRESGDYFMFAIVAKSSGEHVGNLKVGPIQWAHGISDLVTVIGRSEYWGKGFAAQAIRLGTEIAFQQLNLRKLSGGIAEGNDGSVKAYTRGGWVIEGRLRGHHLINGDPRDRIVVSAFNRKFFDN